MLINALCHSSRSPRDSTLPTRCPDMKIKIRPLYPPLPRQPRLVVGSPTEQNPQRIVGGRERGSQAAQSKSTAASPRRVGQRRRRQATRRQVRREEEQAGQRPGYTWCQLSSARECCTSAHLLTEKMGPVQRGRTAYLVKCDMHLF